VITTSWHGAETFDRRRGGLTPETPVREVEGKKT